MALGAISTTLAALQAASGFAPVPALQEAIGLAIIFLKGVQVSRNVYIFGSLTQQFSREPRTIKAPTLNSPRMLVDSF
jgi:Na+/pantothenate symporter